MRGVRNQFGSQSGTVTVAAGMEIESLHYATVGTSYMLRTITGGDTTPTVAWDISAETGHNSRIMGNLAVGAGNAAAPTVDLIVFDASAGGSTKLVARAGDTQSGNLQEWQDNAGTVLCAIDATGALTGSGCPSGGLSQAQTLARVSLRF
jgi:hypothetical protein